MDDDGHEEGGEEEEVGHHMLRLWASHLVELIWTVLGMRLAFVRESWAFLRSSRLCWSRFGLLCGRVGLV